MDAKTRGELFASIQDRKCAYVVATNSSFIHANCYHQKCMAYFFSTHLNNGIFFHIFDSILLAHLDPILGLHWRLGFRKLYYIQSWIRFSFCFFLPTEFDSERLVLLLLQLLTKFHFLFHSIGFLDFGYFLTQIWIIY